MTDEFPAGPAREEPARRTRLLSVLCILTFIGSGLNIISGLAIGTFFSDFVTVANDLAETYKLPGMEMIKESVTRILKDFENEEIIALDNKSIQILKLETLKDISLRG